jgi:hypothetical protein
MRYRELIVGYDIRAAPKQRAPSADTHAAYLLRCDVTPASLDRMIWPSCVSELSGNPSEGWSYRDVLPFADLAQLSAFTARLEPYSLARSLLVKATLIEMGAAEVGLAAALVARRGEPLAEQSVNDAPWGFLGYDVCDASLISGVMNCGYSPREVERLARFWAGLLNDYHLFDHSDAAARFRELTNARVPEHAPFFVFGVHSKTADVG